MKRISALVAGAVVDGAGQQLGRAGLQPGKLRRDPAGAALSGVRGFGAFVLHGRLSSRSNHCRTSPLQHHFMVGESALPYRIKSPDVIGSRSVTTTTMSKSAPLTPSVTPWMDQM